MLYWLESEGLQTQYYARKDRRAFEFCIQKCPNCNRPIMDEKCTLPQSSFVLHGGNVFPDLLDSTDAGMPFFLVSEKALNLFEQHRISGYTGYHSISLEWSEQTEETTQTPIQIPPYYHLDISGKADLDLQAMCLKRKGKCKECGQCDWNRKKFMPRFINENSWNGADLCSLISVPAWHVCSKKIVDLIGDNHLTGFSTQIAQSRFAP